MLLNRLLIILIAIALVGCGVDENKKDYTILKYDFIITNNINGNLKYFSSYYDYQNHIKTIYYDLDSNFSQTSITSSIEEEVFQHGDTLICDGYNFTPSIKINECITIRYSSETGRSYEDINLCLEEVMNYLLIDTCYVFSITRPFFTIDSYNSKIYFDFSRKMAVKKESIDGRGEIVASVELVKETPVGILPNKE